MEVEGVEAYVQVLSKLDNGSSSSPELPTNHDRDHGRQDGLSKQQVRSNTGTARRAPHRTEDENPESTLPTTTDLAKSFLQTEPAEDKAELEAAISSQSQTLSSSVAYSDDGEDDYATGIGTTLALPSFIANFLKGVVDRLQLRVREIMLDVDVEIPNDNLARPGTPSGTETVTLQLKIEDVDIEGITFGSDDPTDQDGRGSPTRREKHKGGTRRITLSKLRGALISDPSLFASMARSSVLSSPVATHSPFTTTSAEQLKSGLDRPSDPITFTDGADEDQVESLKSLEVSTRNQSLSNSGLLSDSGRFDDAPEEDEIANSNHSSLDGFSDPSNSMLEQAAYLPQVTDSRLSQEGENTEGEEHKLPFSFGIRGNGRNSNSSQRGSPVSTLRASVYGPPAVDQFLSDLEDKNTEANDNQTASLPTLLPTRPRPSFIHRSGSQPQVSSELGTPVGKENGQPGLADARLSRKSSSSSDEAAHTGDSTPVGENDLAQSMIFSHEDAESMYMSALSQGSTSTRVSAAWNLSDSVASQSQFVSSSHVVHQSFVNHPDNLEHALQSAASESVAQISLVSAETASTEAGVIADKRPTSDDVSPPLATTQDVTSTSQSQDITSRSPNQSSVSSEEYSRVAKQLFNLDQITIYLPSDNASSTINPGTTADGNLLASRFDGQSDVSQSFSPKIPGAFSVHESRARAHTPSRSTSNETMPSTTTKVATDFIEVVMGKLDAQFDISVGRLVAKLLSSISSAVNAVRSEPSISPEKSESSPLRFHFKCNHISLRFLERLAATTTSLNISAVDKTWTKAPSQDVLLRAKLKGLEIDVDVANTISKTTISLQRFIFGYAKENIVSFDAYLRMRASTRDLAPTAGVDLTVNIIRTRALTNVKISTLPVHVSVDLQRLDETFSWFGGLSSVLNMGGSMASTATVTVASPAKPAKARAVRFEAPLNSKYHPVTGHTKFEARVGGFILDLVGKECIVGIDTTAVKMVNRDNIFGLSIDKIKVSGPHLHHSSREPAIVAEVNVTRVKFLATPENDDLDRLLSLITPSKAQYDKDDEIILDTLLRQRRQGSVLRVTIDSFKTSVSNMEDLKYLPELGEELSRLSTVAKYLPEDDRPGLLSLILVRDADLKVETNNTLGSFQIRVTDFEAAQITFPSLFALSVEAVTVHRNVTDEILGAATDVELREPKGRAPAIMARMIGDEMDPVVKVKLWNLRAEYSVPLLIAILGLSGTATPEEMTASIAASVATLTDTARLRVSTGQGREDLKTKGSRTPELKAMMVDIGFRDCILGLNPLHLPSKVLVVMTEAHISAVLPKDNNAKATAEMSKGSLLIIDDIANILPNGIGKARRQSFDGGSSQVADLCSAGFVSVSYISSAKVVVHITNDKEQREKFVDVEVRDDLLVMESCADSTQTLFATLNGLKPPTIPSQEVKYRTKVIPVQDLLASLSGDAFGTAEGNYDFDEDFGPGLHKGGEDGADDEDTSELDFDSHYYQEEDSMNSHEDNDDYEESRQGSVLFDQLQSHETSDGVLLESFREKEQVHTPEELNIQEDHFGTGSILAGTAHRWNSAKNTYDRSNDSRIRRGPLKVCVRDVHIIWNLFDGYDWQHTRDTISQAVQDVEKKAIERRTRNDRRTTFDQDLDEEETVIGDFLFNSIYIGIPANRDPRELAMAINQELNDNATETESITTTSLSASPSRQGGIPRNKGKRLRLHRSKHHKITFELKGVNVDLVVFPSGSGETESSIDVRVHDFDIFDHVPTSTWKKFATYMHDAGERESGSSQIHLELLNVKPIPELAASEIVLKATVLPLRLHVDQDALDFITRFFEFKNDSIPAQTQQGDVPFLQRVEVNSIPVKLDFKPKRVDYAGLRSGHTTEFMNFLVLDEADMTLRHTIIYGISGFDKLGKCLNDIWMPDIKRNQLPGILAGLAPVRSLANVGGGMRDLVVVPMREYRKDGRVVRSISKGAIAFARTTGTELVKLGAKLAIGTQTVLQGAEEFLSQPPVRDATSAAWDDDDLDEEKKKISLYADQPIGVVQGLRGGYASLERDLLVARDAIIAVPGEVMESGSAQGAAKAVLRRAPTVILRPVIGASKAIGQTLMGATNSLDPQNRRRVEDVSYRFFLSSL